MIQSAKLVPNTAPYFVLLAIPNPNSLSWTGTLAHPNAPTATLEITRQASVRPAKNLVHRVSAMPILV